MDTRTEKPPLCQMTRMWVSAAADGECGETELAAMREHLAQCAECRVWQARAESIVLHVRTAIPAEPSLPFVVPGAGPVRRGRPRRRIRAAALGAAVSASLVLGFIAAGTRTADRPTSSPTRPAPELVARTKGAAGALDGVILTKGP